MHQSLGPINSLGIFLQHKIRNDLPNIIINAQLSQEFYLHYFLHSEIFCCLFVLLKFLYLTNDNTLQMHLNFFPFCENALDHFIFKMKNSALGHVYVHLKLYLT